MNKSIFQLIQTAFGLTENKLTHLIKRSPHSYKIYTIPKKSGGERVIAQPAKETKIIQHWLIDNVFVNLPIHECAAAYKLGASIKANATAHKDNQYISKFDFENFFTSISEYDLINHLTRHCEESLSDLDIACIARLACLRSKDTNKLSLSIGAPSSPILSNSIMYEFDSKINQWCKEKDIIYTRYADDLTFSTNVKKITSEIVITIENTIKSLVYPTLNLNNKKTIHLSKKNQRRITGIIINNNNQISIGRDRKRIISTLIHRYAIGILIEQDIYHLQGMLGFSKDIEPEFILRMRSKYGSKIIDAIFKIRTPIQ